MTKKRTIQKENHERPCLVISRDKAKSCVLKQIEKAATVLNESVNENDDARHWYDFTKELLRQIFSTDELSDEFIEKGVPSIGGADITTGRFLKTLKSIYNRLELYQETVSNEGKDIMVKTKEDYLECTPVAGQL